MLSRRRRSSSSRSSSVSATAAASEVAAPPVSRAVPVLARPFPVVDHCASGIVRTAALPKDPQTGRLGVHFRWNGVGGAVTIKELSLSNHSKNGDGSENHHHHQNHLRVGQAVLAVDGQPVASSRHAARLVRESPHATVKLTTCEPPPPPTRDFHFHRQHHQQNKNRLPPFCKIVAAPLLPRRHPGVVFDATRDRCLVQIARVFSAGPFGNSSSHNGNNGNSDDNDPSSHNRNHNASRFAVHQGDIVLAVNGVPVSTVAAADAALRQQTNPQQQQQAPYTVLYVVDMAAYRRSIGDEMAGCSPALGAEKRVRWIDPDDGDGEDDGDDDRSRSRSRRLSRHRRRNHRNRHTNSHSSATIQLVKRSRHHTRERHFEWRVDFATQRVAVVADDDNSNSSNNRSSRTIAAYTDAFNERLEKRMRVLEEAVNAEAWKHATTTSAAATTMAGATSTTSRRNNTAAAAAAAASNATAAPLERSRSATSATATTEEDDEEEEESSSEDSYGEDNNNNSDEEASSSLAAPSDVSLSHSSLPRPASGSNAIIKKKARSGRSQQDVVNADGGGGGDGGNSNSVSSYCTIPLATATLEVLPVSALQTRAERNSCGTGSGGGVYGGVATQ